MLERLFIDTLFNIRVLVQIICGIAVPALVIGALIAFFMDDFPWWWGALSAIGALAFYAIRYYYDAFLLWLTDPIEGEQDQAAD